MHPEEPPPTNASTALFSQPLQLFVQEVQHVGCSRNSVPFDHFEEYAEDNSNDETLCVADNPKHGLHEASHAWRSTQQLHQKLCVHHVRGMFGCCCLSTSYISEPVPDVHRDMQGMLSQILCKVETKHACICFNKRASTCSSTAVLCRRYYDTSYGVRKESKLARSFMPWEYDNTQCISQVIGLMLALN